VTEIKEYDIPEENANAFTQLVEDLQDVDVNLCLQCRKCTSGCPMADIMDYTPAQLIHAIRLGLKDLVLDSNTYWLCVNCGACVTRCPHEINIFKVMDALASIAIKEGRKPKVPDVASFWNIGVSNITTFGQMYELGIMLPLKIKTGNLFGDLGLGIKMLSQGKLDILPRFQNRAAMKKIASNVKKREKKK
jgi:heterodisulfide reductase subunit C